MLNTADNNNDRRKPELIRKSLHFLIGLSPILAAYHNRITLILLAAGTLAYTIMECLRQRGITIPLVSHLTVAASRRRDRGRFVLGPVTLGMGAILSLLLFPLPAASIAIYALAFGDGTASLAGKFLGRIRPKFLFGKSLEGSIACFLGTFISVWLYTFFRHNSSLCTQFGLSTQLGLSTALIAASTAVVVEIFPVRDWDNIIIPLAVGLVVLIFP